MHVTGNPENKGLNKKGAVLSFETKTDRQSSWHGGSVTSSGPGSFTPRASFMAVRPVQSHRAQCRENALLLAFFSY